MNEVEFQRFINDGLKKRLIKAPIMNVARLIRVVLYQFTTDHRRLRGFKNRFQGERCFIVGNGPSLSIEDLEKIKNEHCFGFNRIYEVFGETSWRPEFYMILDNDVMKKVSEHIDSVTVKWKLLNIMGKTLGLKSDDNTIFFCSYGLYRVKEFCYQKKTISEDISQYISLNFSVAAAAIEVAIYMGFKEIYIIGLDNNFSRWIDKKGKIHFENIEDYKLINAHDYNYFCYQDAVNSCFDCYRKYADNHDIKIINVTRGGNLHSFERRKLEEILNK